MQNFSFKRLTAWLLTLMMVFSLVPVSVSADAMDDFLRDITEYHLSQGNYLGAAGANISAAAAGSGSEDGKSWSSGFGETAALAETTYVLAGSDFQASSHDAGAEIVSGLLRKVKVDYPTMNGFLFAGDYDVKYIDSANGKAKLQETVQAVYGTGMQEIYVQGNHDSDSLVGSTLTASGANDAENYGVFVINEKDYMWRNDDEATIRNTAESLKTYLDAKRNDGYTKPIFVISHLPLHYSMRTRSGGYDGMHANYIFDVLNEAGNAGLSIIFLFGHDHSHGWDDYLGGAAVFLTKGDKINIAQNSTTEFKEETLAFTYMNAGYVGYYGTTYTSDVDKTLTMTVFAITENDVTISRYDSNGTHDLKSAGVYNVEHPDSAYYSTDTTTVGTPYTLTLNTLDGNWVTITAPTEGTVTYSYELTDSITSGESYLIGSGKSGNVNILGSTSTNTISGSTTNGIFTTSSTVADAYKWIFSRNDSGENGYTIQNADTKGYLYPDATYSILKWDWSYELIRNGKNNSVVVNNTAGALKISRQVSIKYVGKTTAYMTSSFGADGSGSPVYLYKIVEHVADDGTPGLYAKITGQADYYVNNGTSAEDALAKVMAGITGYTSNSNTATTGTQLQDSQLTWTMDPNYDKDAAGAYTVTILYDNKILGTVTVNVAPLRITSYSVEPAEGYVDKGASQDVQTGAQIIVRWENGNSDIVPVTVGMLTKADDSAVSTGEIGTYENLKLTYNGVNITNDFTLHVVAKTVNNYPEYPNEGAVKVSKTGTGIDFQSSGITQIEVSASGVPVKKGADVIVMLDLSSSMTNYKVDGKTRLSVLKDSLQSLMRQLKANGEDGQPMDIRIAVADFHRYYTDSNSPYYINSADHLAGGSIRGNTDGTNRVYTGSRSLNADAFVSVHTLAVNAFDGLSTKSGTNYDYAFDAVYQLGEAITAQNAVDGEERDLFVVFMSDGAPFQYNYFSSQSEGNGASYWNNWLQGTMTVNMFADGSNRSYYNKAGKHWMAEAIKGDPATAYPVIRKNNAADTDGDNWVNVNGLGAKMYSIGFCLAVDKEITVTSMDTVIRNIASNENYYFRANSASELNNAFTSIGKDIAYAATNARFVDQMGERFNLQMKTANYTVVDGTTTTTKTLTPKIEILSYDIYTLQDFLNGIITEDRIGDRKGTYTVLETVKFNDAGTEAYSDRIGESVNILIDGVINAETFWYNSTSTDKSIEDVSIPTGVNANGTTTGSSNILPGETFYWKMGTVQTSELAMRYYVYLDGSMEGTREGGSYATNKFATLYYDNYLGNPCKKDTVSPVMAWKEANVSYAFYLVDNDGNIIVNQTTGQTGSFANKIAVTNPVVYETVLLNNETEVSSIDIASLGVLPEGYTLYDYNGTAGATYTVTINSNTAGSWEITSVKDKATTYVTQFNPNDASAYSNAKANHEVGHDYTHTVVWFAVLWKVQALPDSVVIDYGLPVDISVLANDMFGENGKLVGVGAVSDSLNLDGHDATLAPGFGSSYTCKYGEATADTDTGKVRYTPKSMRMDTYDKFAYAVRYTGNENAGFYYDTVTVIPATSIYYEESFLVFDNSKKLEDRITNSKLPESGAVPGKWYVAGEQDNTTQSEDRPGMYSLMDANNIYGYDPAYTNYTEYSLGSARKVTVDAASAGHKDYAPTVSFTFTGKGFDVVSLTDSDAGLIIVSITGDNNYSKNYFVDNYYGYSYTDGKWVVDENSTDSIYQVPVMKVSVPTYGKYNVQIYVIYNEHFEHSGNDSSYSFYMDSVRIYDPANGGGAADNDTVIEDAYKADGEYLPKYLLIKESILSSESVKSDTELNGSVFIDGKGSTNSVSDYNNPGPNNEAYLAQGQSISFKLTADSSSKIDKVHLGMKLAFGNSADVKVTESWQENNTTKTSTLLEQNLETATDMYYEMTPTWDGKTTRVITITNTSGAAVVSLTNVKLTYKDAGNGSNNTGGAPAAAFLTDREVIDVALYLTRKYFIPETFESSVSRSLFGTFEIVKVVTSADAESISINGKTLTTYVPLGEERVWTDIYKKGESEEYEIIAYNAEGLASVTITAAYGKTGTSFGDAMKELYDKINSIFGDIGEALGSETAEGAAETMYSVMEKLAERVFQPEFFQCSFNRTASGENQLVVNTSDDVAYIVADGEIITRYITETIVDLSEESSETVNRVWLVPNGNETTEITAYNAEGVASETADNN